VQGNSTLKDKTQADFILQHREGVWQQKSSFPSRWRPSSQPGSDQPSITIQKWRGDLVFCGSL